MWKDFFYFSKGERSAILILALLIVFVQIAIWTVDYWQPLLPDKLTGLRARREALAAFRDSLSEKDVSGQRFSYADRSRKYPSSQKYGELTAFNPNTADSAKLVSLGLRPYVARNIQKYRQKGGVFRKIEDFARIYGVDPATYARLKPFIRLSSENSASAGGFSSLPGLTRANSNIGLFQNTLAPDARDGVIASEGSLPANVQVGMNGKSAAQYGSLVMDVNKVDTAMLQQLKGVGAASANRIVQYRNSLGGFYSTHQLEEIKGLYPETLSRIKSLLKVDTAQITRINANKASLERLKSHPYISFYQAKVIVELRKARSGIKNINELAEFKEFSSADIDRLRWYLVF